MTRRRRRVEFRRFWCDLEHWDANLASRDRRLLIYLPTYLPIHVLQTVAVK